MTVVFYAFYAVVVLLCFVVVGAVAGLLACLLVRLRPRLLLAAASAPALGWWIWAGWVEPVPKGISRPGWLVYVGVSSVGFVQGSLTGRGLAARARRAPGRFRRRAAPPPPPPAPGAPIVSERLVLAPITPQVARALVAGGDRSAIPAGRGWPHAGTLATLEAVGAGARGWFVLLDGLVIGEATARLADGEVELGCALAEPYRKHGYEDELLEALGRGLAGR